MLSADRLRALIETVPDGLILCDEQGQIEYVNGRLEDLSGYAKDELIGMPLEVLVPARYRRNHAALQRAYREQPAVRMMGHGRWLELLCADGSTIAVEIGLAPVELDGVIMTAASVRDVHELREIERVRARQADLTELVSEITSAVLASAGPLEIYQRAAHGASRLLNAENACLILFSHETHNFITVASEGTEAMRHLIREVTLNNENLASFVERREPFAVEKASETKFNRIAALVGPGVVAPFKGPELTRGFLTAFRDIGAAPFTDEDVELLGELSRRLSIAIELGSARIDRERLSLIEERHRIANDLHDTVIQDLIGIGLQLLLGVKEQQNAEFAERDNGLVSQLEEAVRVLRSIVLEVRTQPEEGKFTDSLSATLAEASRSLGHKPGLIVKGDLNALPPRVTGHLLPVLREALSNIARHAHASVTEIVLTYSGDTVTLIVDDDGDGLPEGFTPGLGTSTLAERAATLNGGTSLDTSPIGGTRLVWTAHVGQGTVDS